MKRTTPDTERLIIVQGRVEPITAKKLHSLGIATLSTDSEIARGWLTDHAEQNSHKDATTTLEERITAQVEKQVRARLLAINGEKVAPKTRESSRVVLQTRVLPEVKTAILTEGALCNMSESAVASDWLDTRAESLPENEDFYMEILATSIETIRAHRLAMLQEVMTIS